MGSARTATRRTEASRRRTEAWAPPAPDTAARTRTDATSAPRRVFVSYSRSEAMLVDDLSLRLRRAGFDVWVDYQDLIPGASWEPQLAQAIDEADVVVLVHSRRASMSSYVADEWGRAIGHGTPIVLAVAEAAPVDQRLAGVPWVDLRVRYGRAVDRLIDTISAAADPPAPTGDRLPPPMPMPPTSGFRAPLRVWAAIAVSVPIALASLAAIWTIIVPVVLLPLPARIVRRSFNYVDVRNALIAVPFTILVIDAAITGSDEGTDLALESAGAAMLLGALLWLLIRGGSFRRWVMPAAARPRWRRHLVRSDRRPTPIRYRVDAAPEDGGYAEVVDGVLARYGHQRVDDGSESLVLRFVSQYHDVTELDPRTRTLPIVVADADDEMPVQLRRTQWLDLRRGAQKWRIHALARHLDEPMGLFDEIGSPPPHDQHVLPDRVQGLFVSLWIGIASVIGYWVLLLTGARSELRELGVGSLVAAALLGVGVVAAMLWLTRRLRLRRPGRLRASAVPLVALASAVMASLVDYDPEHISGEGAVGVDNAGVVGLLPFLLLAYFAVVGSIAVRRWIPPHGLERLNAGRGGTTGTS